MSVEKAKLRIRALLAQAESEAREQTDSGTGEKLSANIGASILYAQKAQELLMKYHLEMDDIQQIEKPLDYIPPTIEESIVFNPLHRANARIRGRMYWFEELAKVVAKGYFCKAGVNANEDVFFVGLDMDREIASMVFLNLAEVAHKLMPIELKKAKAGVGIPSWKPTGLEFKTWPGDEAFEQSFHAGFREQIEEIYKEHSRETSSIAVEDYWKANYYAESYRLANDYPPRYEINETAKEIGKKAARVTTKKIGGITQDAALAKQNALVKQRREAILSGNGGEVYVIFDNSYSMIGEKLFGAKNGAKEYARDAIEQQKFSVGLIEFNSDSKHLIAPTKSLEDFNVKVDPIYATGGTDLLKALKEVRIRFQSRGNIRKVICVITDGDTAYPNECIRFANDLKRSGIEIMAIGTEDVNQDFIDRLVSRKGLGLLVSTNDFGSGIRKMAGLLSS